MLSENSGHYFTAKLFHIRDNFRSGCSSVGKLFILIPISYLVRKGSPFSSAFSKNFRFLSPHIIISNIVNRFHQINVMKKLCNIDALFRNICYSECFIAKIILPLKYKLHLGGEKSEGNQRRW